MITWVIFALFLFVVSHTNAFQLRRRLMRRVHVIIVVASILVIVLLLSYIIGGSEEHASAGNPKSLLVNGNFAQGM